MQTRQSAGHTRFALLVVLAAVVPALGGVNQPMIDKVAAGKVKTANADWWGFNEEDSTEAVQAAIDSGARRLIIPNVGKPWIVRPLFLASNQEIVFEKGVEVLAKSGEFHGGNDCLFEARDKENITLKGSGATLRMRRDDYADPAMYSKAEWRSALQFKGCSKIDVYGLTLAESGGDGIYLERCRNVHIRDCIMDKNYRQGMSIISAENLLVENCVMKNTSGTAPAAGIDVEPDGPDELLANVVFRNCVAENNAGPGMYVFLGAQNANAPPISIRFEKCRVSGCGANGLGVHQIRGSTGMIEFVDCTVDGAKDEGFRVHRCGSSREDPDYGPNCRVRLVRCTFRNGGGPALRCILGGVELVDCVIEDGVDRPFLDMKGQAVHDITGRVTVRNPHGARMSLGEGSTGIALKVIEEIPTDAKP